MARRIKPRAKSRGPRGTGTVFYSAARKCYVARKTVHGQRIERTGRTQEEAIRRRDEALPPGPNTTVGEWADRWLQGLRVRPSTRENYRRTVESKIKPEFGRLKLTALTTWHIEHAAAEWTKGDDGIGPGTLATYLGRLSNCLQAAVRAELIERNPVTHVRRQRRAEIILDLFTPAELRQIIDFASTRREWYPFALAAATGCRIGEALAIRPDEDYDPDTGELSIARTMNPNGTGTGPPKSARSKRTIRVPEIVRPLLISDWPTTSYQTAAGRWRNRFLKDLGLRYRNLHQLRHSVASHALAGDPVRGIRGVPLANLARDLGDTVDTIVKTYVHKTAGADVCGTMELLLGGGKVSAVAAMPGKAS